MTGAVDAKELLEFPFLIGTVRTNEVAAKVDALTEVSIPHRYGKNHFIIYIHIINTLFPFLIGTVRTMMLTMRFAAIYRLVSIPHRYGKNYTSLSHLLYFFSFPFLIGTVRTQLA